MDRKKLNKAKEIDDFEFYVCGDKFPIWRWKEETVVRMKKGTFDFETVKGTFGSYYEERGTKKRFSKSNLWLAVRNYIKHCEKQGISKREMVERTIEEFKGTPELQWNVLYKGYKYD